MTKTMIITIWAVLTALVMQAQSPTDFDLTGYTAGYIAKMAGDARIERANESPEGDLISFNIDGVGFFIARFYEGLSFQSGFAPAESQGMRKLISALNEEAVITGDDEWKIYYDSGHVTLVTLDYLKLEEGSTWMFNFELVGVP